MNLGDLCLDILLRIALMQPDPAERRAMLEILREDGWLTAEDCVRMAEVVA